MRSRSSSDFSCRYKKHRRGSFQLRPYTLESTASRPICEVKLVMAQSVLWWGTTREYGVLKFCSLTFPIISMLLGVLVGLSFSRFVRRS